MKRFSLLLLYGTFLSSMAVAATGKFTTGKGGDPTDISSNGGSFSFEPINGGGVFFYDNIGPNPITSITVKLTATAGPNQTPYQFTAQTLTPAEGQLSELEVTGFEHPPEGTTLLDWDFSSYIFASIALSGTTTGEDCAGNIIAQASCVIVTMSNGSIPVGGEFGFDLNDNFTADIDPKTGEFLPDAATNPPSGGFGGINVASGTVNGPSPTLGAVPEPASFGMLAFGAAALIGIGARRRRARS
jgi:PEP-CTERM motif